MLCSSDPPFTPYFSPCPWTTAWCDSHSRQLWWHPLPALPTEIKMSKPNSKTDREYQKNRSSVPIKLDQTHIHYPLNIKRSQFSPPPPTIICIPKTPLNLGIIHTKTAILTRAVEFDRWQLQFFCNIHIFNLEGFIHLRQKKRGQHLSNVSLKKDESKEHEALMFNTGTLISFNPYSKTKFFPFHIKGSPSVMTSWCYI